jgi:hypothetical protein
MSHWQQARQAGLGPGPGYLGGRSGAAARRCGAGRLGGGTPSPPRSPPPVSLAHLDPPPPPWPALYSFPLPYLPLGASPLTLPAMAFSFFSGSMAACFLTAREVSHWFKDRDQQQTVTMLWTEALVATSENPQSERAHSVRAVVCQSLSVMSHDYCFVVKVLQKHLQRMQDQQPQQTNVPNKRSRKSPVRMMKTLQLPFSSFKMM